MIAIEGVVSSGIGSWPGTDLADALKITFAECPDLPYLPELPARGPHTALIGRSVQVGRMPAISRTSRESLGPTVIVLVTGEISRT